jgi:hypothetical protein
LGFSGATISFFGSDPHPITKVIQHAETMQNPKMGRTNPKNIELRPGRHVAFAGIVLFFGDEFT